MPADAAKQTLRDVLDYMSLHGGRLPSQRALETRKLYFRLRRLRRRQDLTGSTTAMLREIQAGQEQPSAARNRQRRADCQRRAEETLRRVLHYVRHHGGWLPPWDEDDTKKLYNSFIHVRKKQDLTATATAMLREIQVVYAQAVAEQGCARAESIALRAEQTLRDVRD